MISDNPRNDPPGTNFGAMIVWCILIAYLIFLILKIIFG